MDNPPVVPPPPFMSPFRLMSSVEDLIQETQPNIFNGPPVKIKSTVTITGTYEPGSLTDKEGKPL